MISYLKERTQKSQLALKALINPLPSPSTANLIHFFCLDTPSIIVTHFSLQCLVLFSSIAEFIPHSKNLLRLFPHGENPSLSFPTIQILLPSLILPLFHTCDYISPIDLFLLWMYAFLAYTTNFSCLCSSWLFSSWSSPLDPKISPSASVDVPFLSLFHPLFPPQIHPSLAWRSSTNICHHLHSFLLLLLFFSLDFI